MADVSIVIVQGPNEGREFEVSGAIVIGRDTSAGLVIDDPEASRRHASLMLDGSALSVEDLGSTNGTFVNGARISAPQSLDQGDKLRIGTTVFEVRIEAAEESQATRVGTALPDLDDLQVTAPRQVPDFAKEEPTAEAPAAPEPPAPEPEPPAVPEPPAPEPVVPEPIQPTAAGIPQPPAPTNAPPPSSGPPGGAVAPPGGGPAGGPPPPPGGPPPPPSMPPPGPPPPPAAAPPPPPSAPPPSFAPAPPPAGPPATYGGGGVPAGPAYPVRYEADYPEAGIARWRCFFQGLLVYPHFFVLCFVGIGAFFAYVWAWFAILFTGRYPLGAYNFLTGTARWANRVNGFSLLMTERYPPFSLDEAPDYPIRTHFEYPEKIARWRPLLQYIMAYPHILILYFLWIGAFFALVYAWFVILFTRRYPPGVFNYIAGVGRWGARVQGFILLTTEQYPPFSLD